MLKTLLLLPYIFPVAIVYILSVYPLISHDLLWVKYNGKKAPILLLINKFSKSLAFRTLLCYRLKSSNKIIIKLLGYLFSVIYKLQESFYIMTPKLGGGLHIQHGYSTIINAESIGINCFINQNVTIGSNGQGNIPIIGNNVMIRVGAVVVGRIKVGDGSIIGANAVVTKDVPSNCTVGGVPAKIIKNKGSIHYLSSNQG